MTPILTIAIPTRDRNELVRKHLAILLPQLTAETRMVIYDNTSSVPVADSLAELLGQFPLVSVTVTRNRTNIGSSANVMRCIEQCETPWLWILGDDDRPMPNAVALALAAIHQHGDCLAINFSSMEQNPDAVVISDGMENYLRDAPSFPNTTLISNNLYRANRLAAHVRTGYFYAYSLYPHLACVLSELHASGGQCCFLAQRLVEWGPDSHWSKLMAGAGMGVLLDLPMPHSARRILAPKLVGVAGRLSSLTILLLDQIGRTIDAPTARYLHEQAYQRLYRHEHRLANVWYRWLGKLVLRMPKFSSWLYGQYRARRSGHGLDRHRDHLSRM